MKKNQTIPNSTILTQNYNDAIGETYYREIKSLIREYYTAVSEAAINEFLRTGNFAQLTAEELLIRNGLAQSDFDIDNEKVASNFITKLQLQSNAAYRKSYAEIKKPLPEPLIRPHYFNQNTKNLISEQVQKIKGLENYQYQKINEAVQQTITQNKTMASLKKSIKEAEIYNEKKIKTIAQNQLNYATTIVYENKAQELGLTKASWYHPPKSVYKTEPRPSHVEANGRVFDLKKGCKIDGEYIHPGQLINCKCSFRLLIT